MSAPDPHAARTAPSSLLLERLLRRDGVLTIAALVLLWLLTTVYVVAGAGLGMNAWDMTRMALLPQHHAAPLGDMSTMDMGYLQLPTWGATYWLLMVGMWWTMMIAMMIPSAAPTILLHARVHRHAQAQGQVVGAPPIAAFVAGYCLVWLGFSGAATVLQWGLEQLGLLSAMTMGVQVQWLSGVTLIAAGLYQFTSWKRACLAHCRSPAAFLSSHRYPGASGALRLGFVHGTYCLGCCWLLMALLFVGGVMNLVWIAVLTALVLAEKAWRSGPWAGHVVGALLIVWGTLILW